MKHTKTPWEVRYDEIVEKCFTVTAGGCGVETCVSVCLMNNIADLNKANSEFIVRVVNSHEELLEAASKALSIAESWIHDQLEGTTKLQDALNDLKSIKRAIANVEGKK